MLPFATIVAAAALQAVGLCSKRAARSTTIFASAGVNDMERGHAQRSCEPDCVSWAVEFWRVNHWC